MIYVTLGKAVSQMGTPSFAWMQEMSTAGIILPNFRHVSESPAPEHHRHHLQHP